ncbi:DUF4817 domain-containing protein [Trichonephila clavipes]|nr:DUF4817 domain-containing protein [Trichonephila clavipes]
MIALELAKKVWNKYVKHFVGALQNQFDKHPGELQMPRSTIHDVLHKRSRLTAYKVLILHAIKPDDYAKRYGFAVDILHRLDADEHFLNRVLFSDESTFHVSGMVNKHNVRFWGSEQPYVVRELQRSSEKVNLWCGLLYDRII